MKLYVLQTCPYCIRVLEHIEKKNINIDVVDVPGSHGQRTELRQVSGQTFVPTLVDGETIIADDDEAIIRYLSEKENAGVK